MAEQTEPKYIVNPGGAVHPVTADEFDMLVRPPGSRYREASAEEAAAWYEEQKLAVPDSVAKALPAKAKAK